MNEKWASRFNKMIKKQKPFGFFFGDFLEVVFAGRLVEPMEKPPLFQEKISVVQCSDSLDFSLSSFKTLI